MIILKDPSLTILPRPAGKVENPISSEQTMTRRQWLMWMKLEDDHNIKDPRNILIDMLMGTESDYSDEGEELWH